MKFLRLSGAFRPASEASFWSRIESTLGGAYAEELSEALERRAEGELDAEQLYGLLFRNAEAALLTSGLVSPILESWLAFVERIDLPSGDLLNLGSGSGLPSLFYAYLRPDAEVVGVDESEAAVAAATEIATRLRISNARFEVATLDRDWTPPHTFRVVVSTTLLRELEPEFGSDFALGFSTQVQMEQALKGGRSQLAVVAQRALSDGGRYLSLERLANPVDVASWVGALGHLGLGVDLGPSRILLCRSPWGEEEHLPALVAGSDFRSPSPKELWSFLGEDKTLYAELAAETELQRHAPIQLVRGWQAGVLDQSGHGATQLAIFRDSNERVILYLTTSRGYRQVIQVSDGEPSTLFVEAERWLERFRSDPNVLEIHELSAGDVHES